MITIIGVRFRNVGKVYYFSPRELDICVGDHVIVETARGVEYGFVVLGPKEVDDSKVIQPLKEVIRIATPKDDALIEIPDRHGTGRAPDFITSFVNESIGLKL